MDSEYYKEMDDINNFNELKQSYWKIVSERYVFIFASRTFSLGSIIRREKKRTI